MHKTFFIIAATVALLSLSVGTTANAKNTKKKNFLVVKVNKSTNTVGALKFSFSKIKNEKVKNKEVNYTDAEENMDDQDNLKKEYYRTTVYYELRNLGKEPVDLSYSLNSIIDDSGKDYSDDGSASGYGFDTLAGEKKLQPKTSKTGRFILISNHKITITKPRINVGDEYSDDENEIADGGIAAIAE
ncbi:hypothetical protein [Liquorilactobacillus capillatus]|nr:hypothetical protein [Liquorilactobacillus capillatus]